jgi:DNA-directed RNA polymerase subunit omega
MEILYTVDCERFIPNRFELVLVAAARARAIARGAEPRVDGEGTASRLALREIAAGRFNSDEIQALLAPPRRDAEDLISVGVTDEEALRDGMAQSGAIALASQQREALVTASMNEGGR